MPNDVTKVTVLKLAAWMRADDVARLMAEVPSGRLRLPEECFLRDMSTALPDAEGRVPVDPRLRWAEVASGSTYGSLVTRIAPLISGALDAVFEFENGQLRGLRVRDGVVSEHSVIVAMTLAE